MESVDHKKRLCLVGARGAFLREALSLGVEILAVQTPEEYRGLPADLAAEVTSLVLDYQDTDRLVELVSALHAVRPLDAVVTVFEEALLPVARLVDALGLPGVPHATVTLLTDKWAMRRHLREAGVSSVLAELGTGRADLAAFGGMAGYPFIAKPVAGSASLGIFKVESADDIDRVHEGLTAVGLGTFLMEEFLEGPEISVDGLSFHGRYVPVAICDKILGPDFVEFGHCLPARLSPETEQEVVELVAEFLDCVGLAEGLSHVEVKLTPAGPRIVEGHNRRGGDRLNTMAESVYGFSLERTALELALGVMPERHARPEAKGASSVCFFAAERGVVKEVTGAEEVRAHAQVLELHINFPAGQEVPPLRWSLDRAGYVVVHADTADAAEALARDLAGRIAFAVEPKDFDTSAERDDLRALVGEIDQSNRLGYARPAADAAQERHPA
ncbi:ATP-grasp domain-containing protein [Streptomyces sp. NBC_01431]|uniref:ATP-grasp domain-containing protein n=1 Tax=Streptomyces sp. NBC_01431 TaxID=2903863 RepID=UPI002E368CFD|nr:ATP-grasp domain-containing protein [Streptomyces sp. NBC_01431]